MTSSFLVRLAAADAALDERGVNRRSLAPQRARATSLVQLGKWLQASTELSPSALEATADGLDAVVTAIAESFPENIFWDLDAMVGALAHDAATAPAPEEHLREQLALVTELQRVFGSGSTIRFRYIHDFAYGYDWAKWVRRDVEARRSHGPFSPAFLAYSKRRGHELLELIAQDDAKYRKLRDGETARNPFGFSREPEDEIVLHRDLAERGLVPVEAWRVDAEPTWSRDYAALRRERALALGLGG